MKLSNSSVCIVGDIMLDRYWHGDTDRISPEAPVPVVNISSIDERLGGAANVALNCVALGAKVTLIGCVGDDEAGRTLTALLSAAGIDARLVVVANKPTVTKLRVLGRSQQLIRLDFEKSFHESFDALLAEFEAVVAKTDVVVLSDYAKGVLTQPQPFIRKAKAHDKPVLVDPKQKDWSCYEGATLVTPNLKEFQEAVGRFCVQDADIEQEARFFIEKKGIGALLVTRGSHGMSLVEKNTAAHHIPAQAKEVYDVTGAGDTVLAALAVSLGSGHSLIEAAELANRAAGIVVGKLGTATVTLEELGHVEPKAPYLRKVVSEDELLYQLHTIRQSGQRVVMTNGCFDILHPGHIQYLEQAKALGDILIIAVNDDASVQRLKGPTRPVNSLDHRMQVLAGLQSVDFVVDFSEDTPLRIITRVMPQVLCKGGDYEISAIAGSKEVLAHGGQVKILPFVDGCSTTRTIQKIQQETV